MPALLAELVRIQRSVPNDQLAITWDAVHGVPLWEYPSNSYVSAWFDEPLRCVPSSPRQRGRRGGRTRLSPLLWKPRP